MKKRNEIQNADCSSFFPRKNKNQANWLKAVAFVQTNASKLYNLTIMLSGYQEVVASLLTN